MKIVIRAKNVKLNQSLREWIDKKLNSLERFISLLKEEDLDSFLGKGKPKIEMWVEIEKMSSHHRKGPFFRAEAQMRFPGKSLRAEARDEDLRVAITTIKDELQRQVKKYKNKRKAKIKRGARKLKKEMNLSTSAQFPKRKGVRVREEGV